MSLLTLIQSVARSPGVGVEAPTQVVASSDRAVVELLQLANTSGEELAANYDFPELQRENTFTTTAAADQGAFNSAVVTRGDFLRMIDDTLWNRTLDEQYTLASPQDWQAYQANGMAIIDRKFIIRQGHLYLGYQTPTAGQTAAFEYYSKFFCEAADGTAKAAFTVDTDVCVLPERLMKLDIIWRWKAAKGLEYADDLETANIAINSHVGSAGGRKLLILGGDSSFNYGVNIPEGNWS